MDNPNYQERAELRKQIESEEEEKKKEALEKLNKEKAEKLDLEKEAIRQKFLAGAQTEAELRQELQELMHGNKDNLDAAIKMADKEKDKTKDKLEQRLAQRKRDRENRIAKLKEDQDADLDTFDIEQLEE